MTVYVVEMLDDFDLYHIAGAYSTESKAQEAVDKIVAAHRRREKAKPFPQIYPGPTTNIETLEIDGDLPSWVLT